MNAQIRCHLPIFSCYVYSIPFILFDQFCVCVCMRRRPWQRQQKMNTKSDLFNCYGFIKMLIWIFKTGSKNITYMYANIKLNQIKWLLEKFQLSFRKTHTHTNMWLCLCQNRNNCKNFVFVCAAAIECVEFSMFPHHLIFQSQSDDWK